MAPHAGPASRALILFCALGTLLAAPSVSTRPVSARDRQKLLSGLRHSVATLYTNYSQCERGVPTPPDIPILHASRPPLPDHADPCPGSLLPFVRAIRLTVLKSLPGSHEVDEIIDMLERLQVRGTPETPVSTPESFFEEKLFALSVLKQLSACV